MRDFMNIVENVGTIDALAKRLRKDFQNVQIIPEQWLIHFSPDAEAISRQGFTKGTPLDHDNWKGTWGRSHNGPGFNFAVQLSDDESMEYWASHCPLAVVFRAQGVKCWHKDGFDQVIFEGSSVHGDMYFITTDDHGMDIDDMEFKIAGKSGVKIDGPEGSLWDIAAAIRGGSF